ncbi:oligosaccharide flippase family protein [Patulibacter defluvii]|uniref:oligosaccharide flippase family protein n=1 Tax=Patulibacter defluvii TaxID=3095358 RepID=UPI002A7628E5|nr:oligosaccharide flippase family protein [Patulibacter sp. DM4]
MLDTGDAGGRVVSGGALRVVSYVLGALVTVVSASVVARHLGKEGFGGFTTVVSLSTVALVIADFGLATLGVREYVTRKGAERDHLMRVMLGMRLTMMALGAAGMLVFAALAGFDGQLWLGTVLAGAGLVIYALPVTYVIPLQAALRLGWVGAIDLGRQVSQALLQVLLVVAGAGTGLLLGAAVPAAAVALVIALVAARGLAPLTPAFDLAAMRRLLRISIAFAAATSIGTLYPYVAQVVTDLSTSDTESGLFALSFRVFAVVVGTAMIAVSSAFPILAHTAGRDQARFGYAGSRTYQATILLGSLAAVGIGAGAPLAVEILGGAKYADATDVLRVHAAAIIGSFAVATGSFLLLAQHRQRTLLQMNGVTLLVSLILTAVAARQWGAIGAASAMVATEIGLALAYYVVLRRGGYGLRLERRWVAAIVASLVAAGGVAVAVAAVTSGTVGDVLETGAATLTFLVAVLVLRAVPEEVLAPLRARLGRG